MLVDDEARPPQEEAVEAGRLSRKTFLGRTAAAAGGVALLGASGAQASRLLRTAGALGGETYAPAALAASEMSTLKAVLSQLLPKDELGPGAVVSGVHIYIDQ